MSYQDKTKEALIKALKALEKENISLKKSFDVHINERELAQNKFKMLFEQSPIGMALVKHDTGAFLEVNNSVLKATGYTKEEFINLSYWDITPREYEEQEIKQLQELNETGRFGPNTKEYIRKDGTRYPLSISGALYEDINGQKVVWGIIEDITERRLAEETIKKSEQQLKELNATKDKLFSIIAHDLRSPFSGIQSLSQLFLAKRDQSKPLDPQKYFGLINSTAKNSLKLLDNLLNWAKTQTGGLNVKPERIVVSEVIQEIINLKSSFAKTKNITFKYSPAYEIETFTDKDILKTILRNLMSNAIKFTKPGGTINITTISNQKHVEITVLDNGIGMSQDTINQLFDISTNTTLLGTENEKGSGLGLVLCKEFVNKLGGEITVESEEGKGSHFKFKLPVIHE